MELEKKLDEGLANIKTQIEEKTATFGETKSALDALTAQFNEYKEKSVNIETINAMQKHLDALDAKMQKRGKVNEVAKSFATQILEQLNENKDGLSGLIRNQSASVNLEVKAVGDMIFGDFTGDTPSMYAGHDYTASVDRVLGKAGNCPNVLQQVVNRGTIGGNRVVYVDMFSEGEAGMTGEGEKKTQVSFNMEETSKDVKKITAFIKVSKEMLSDLDFLRAEINTELREKIENKLEEQIYEGAGTTVNLEGITKYLDTPFTGLGGAFAGAIPFANGLDAIRIAVADIASDCFEPNLVVLNPADLAIMDLNKSQDGSYLIPPFLSTDGMRIAGVRVMGSSTIPVGEVLVGDFSKANLRIREDFNISIGYENDDFTKNMVTILAEMRAVFYIKQQHVKAFRRGTLATIVENITTPNEI